MLARIINNGHRRVYPTCIGDLRIPKCQEYTLNDRKAIQELQAYPDLCVEIIEDESSPPVDFSKYPINQLRNIATKAGIKKAFFLKKVDLIKFLEETHESTI